MTRALALAFMALVAVGFVRPARGEVRLQRIIGVEVSPHASSALDIAFDDRGFLWIAGYLGLARYDGREVTPWAEGRIHGEVSHVQPHGDRVFAATADALYCVERSEVRVIEPPATDERGSGPGALASTEAGLWAIYGQELWSFDDDGWRRPIDLPPEARLVSLRTTGGRLFVLARHHVFEVLDAAVLRDFEVFLASGVAVDGNRRLIVTALGKVVSFDAEGEHLLYETPDRGNAIVRRNGATWAFFDTQFVRLGDDGSQLVTEAHEGLVMPGRPVLMDAEGSIWSVTFRGLVQMPEPDTVYFGPADGLQSAHTRYVSPKPGGGLLVSSWQAGVGSLVGGAASTDPTHDVKSKFCADGMGRVWAVGRDELVAWDANGSHAWPIPTRGATGSCTADPEGTIWFSLADRVISSEAVETEPTRAAWMGPVEGGYLGPLWVEGGTLSVAHDGKICSVPRPSLDDLGQPLPWQCASLEGVEQITATVSLGDSERWIATSHRGVLHRREGDWVPVASSDVVPVRRVNGLAPSPRGGAWVLGPAMLMRVAPDPTHPGQWSVAERLGPYNGLFDIDGTDIYERADGTLFLTTSDGVATIAESARAARPAPPLHGAIEVDGAFVDPKADESLPIRLLLDPSGDVQLRFTALVLRDPNLVRYRMRRDGGPWTALSGPAEVHFVGLPPGRHSVVFGASTDGEAWTNTRTIQIDVRPPWWSSPLGWALLAVALLVALAGWWWSRPVVRRRAPLKAA